VQVQRKDNSVSDTVFSWGEYRQHQLSSGSLLYIASLAHLILLADIRNYMKPQPMRWAMKFLNRFEYTPIDISCGGYHTLLLFAPVRQVSRPPLLPPRLVTLDPAVVMGRWGIWSTGRWLCMGQSEATNYSKC
jgi:hypothetical protein